MAAKAETGHVWPRDPRKSCVVYADWIDSASYMSDADFRQAMTVAIRYGTEGLTTDEIIEYVRGLDPHEFHQEIILFWFLGVRGALDAAYDSWQKMRNHSKERGKKTQEKLEDVKNLPTEKDGIHPSD